MSAVEPPFLAELRQEFARVAEADAQASAAEREGRRGRPRMPRLRQMGLRTALPALAAVAALGGGTFVVVEGISLREEVPPVTTGPRPQGASGFDHALVREISALSRTHTDADVIDPDIVEKLPAGLLLESSLLIDPPAPGEGSGATPSDAKAWLVPTADGRLALVTSVRYFPPQTKQGVLADVARGRMFATVQDEIAGVVPDGVTHVTAHMRDGDAELPVRDNTFAAHLPSPLVGIEWDGMTRP